MKRLKDAIDEPATLVDRLRGIFRMQYPNAGPDYKTPPIQHEAAREIERLRGEMESLNVLNSALRSDCNRYRQEIDEMNKQLVHCGGVISKSEAYIERLERKAPTQEEILSLEFALNRQLHKNG